MEPALSLSGVRSGNKIKWPPGAIIRGTKAWASPRLVRDREALGVEVRYDTSAVALSRTSAAA